MEIKFSSVPEFYTRKMIYFYIYMHLDFSYIITAWFCELIFNITWISCTDLTTKLLWIIPFVLSEVIFFVVDSNTVLFYLPDFFVSFHVCVLYPFIASISYFSTPFWMDKTEHWDPLIVRGSIGGHVEYVPASFNYMLSLIALSVCLFFRTL